MIIDLMGFLAKVQNQIEVDKKKLEDNGFVIDNLEDRWQKLAFTLYTDIAALSTEAGQIITELLETGELLPSEGEK